MENSTIFKIAVISVLFLIAVAIFVGCYFLYKLYKKNIHQKTSEENLPEENLATPVLETPKKPWLTEKKEGFKKYVKSISRLKKIISIVVLLILLTFIFLKDDTFDVKTLVVGILLFLIILFSWYLLYKRMYKKGVTKEPEVKPTEPEKKKEEKAKDVPKTSKTEKKSSFWKTFWKWFWKIFKWLFILGLIVFMISYFAFNPWHLQERSATFFGYSHTVIKPKNFKKGETAFFFGPENVNVTYDGNYLSTTGYWKIRISNADAPDHWIIMKNGAVIERSDKDPLPPGNMKIEFLEDVFGFNVIENK